MRFVTALVLSVLGTLVFLMVLGLAMSKAHARDPDGRYANSALSEWYRSLKQPDTGVSCCGEADAVEADEWRVHPDGSVTATVTDGRGYMPNGMVVEVPPGKVLRGEANPTGHAILFLRRDGGAYCFVIGAGI